MGAGTSGSSKRSSRKRAVGLVLLVLLLALLSTSCNFSLETLTLITQSGQTSGRHPEIQLSPPPQILPGNDGPTAAGVSLEQTTAEVVVSPTAFQPLDASTSATVTLTTTSTTFPLPGTQTITPTFTATPSPSPTVTTTRTITPTLPPGTQPASPTPTATRTITVTPVSSPTHTNTPTPTDTHVATVPPPLPTATHTPTTTPSTCNPSGNGGFESTLIGLINQERQSRGMGMLSPQSQLTTAARNHSADMACNDFFSHTGSDGSLPWDRISAQGYSYSAVAENIFAGSSSAQAAFDAWMNSPGHRDNMLNASYTEIGIGYRYWADSSYSAYTTAVFALPR